MAAAGLTLALGFWAGCTLGALVVAVFAACLIAIILLGFAPRF